VEITQRAEDDDDEEDEDDDEEEPVAGPSSLTPPSRPDPFDLLITEDVSVDPSFILPTSDDDDSEGDPDPDELSSVDGEGSDDEERGTSIAKLALEREKKRVALRSMRAKLDGMLCYFFEHLEECMGGRAEYPPAAEMAASTLTAASSGTSTPTSEYPMPIVSMPSLAARRSPSTPAQSLAHFQTLLNLFSRQILPTSATQHIPFLLFFTSSFSPAHTDLFLGLLVSQALYATSTTAPTLATQPISISQRVAAAVYIGGVVCRARFVTDEQARQVVTYLLAYIDGKMHQSRTNRHTDELPLFYAVCQAVMLIFCFRWRAFTAGTEHEHEHEGMVGEMELDGDSVDGTDGAGGDSRWMADLDILQRAITSELNPLLGCNPDIVSRFAKVAHQTGFAYCFSIIESNASATRSSHTLNKLANATTSAASLSSYTASSGVKVPTPGGPSLTLPRQARQSNIDAGLDNYFPFDPYDLPRSNAWVERRYRTWAEVNIGAAESDDEDNEEDEDEDEEDVNSEESPGLEDEWSGRFGSMSNSIGARSLPKPVKMGPSAPSSFDKRRFLKEGQGLSSSLEGMSISPNVTGFAR
jgi:RNA polymerase I-specific transcription initiation factor RRN3